MIAPVGKRFLDIGNGLRIGLKDKSIWQVWAKNGSFDLIETADFYRVMLLLEKPYMEVKSVLDSYADSQGAEAKFALWRVVGAGLACKADQWARLALDWLPHLPEDDRARLHDWLLQVRGARWASQKSRQLASRYLMEIRSLDP